MYHEGVALAASPMGNKDGRDRSKNSLKSWEMTWGNGRKASGLTTGGPGGCGKFHLVQTGVEGSVRAKGWGGAEH